MARDHFDYIYESQNSDHRSYAKRSETGQYHKNQIIDHMDKDLKLTISVTRCALPVPIKIYRK